MIFTLSSSFPIELIGKIIFESGNYKNAFVVSKRWNAAKELAFQQLFQSFENHSQINQILKKEFSQLTHSQRIQKIYKLIHSEITGLPCCLPNLTGHLEEFFHYQFDLLKVFSIIAREVPEAREFEKDLMPDFKAVIPVDVRNQNVSSKIHQWMKDHKKDLEQVVVLSLSSYKLTYLPWQVTFLTKMATLGLQDTQLKHVPDFLHQLPALEYANITSDYEASSLEEFNAFIDQLKSLQTEKNLTIPIRSDFLEKIRQAKQKKPPYKKCLCRSTILFPLLTLSKSCPGSESNKNENNFSTTS